MGRSLVSLSDIIPQQCSRRWRAFHYCSQPDQGTFPKMANSRTSGIENGSARRRYDPPSSRRAHKSRALSDRQRSDNEVDCELTEE
eukprot:m.16735 g.16735  ORF g.16735 m.16735 type:complete len:86 (+) comp27110_c0_seq1:37-294(+)